MEFILSAPKNSIAFYLFNFPVRFYGITMGFAIIVGFIFSYYFLKKKYSQSEADKFVDYSPFLILFSILGARLFYVVGLYRYYLYNPFEIIMINHGGISIWGAIIFGILSLIVLSKIFKFNLINHMSVIALILPICQAIGRWGNYFNQEAFGRPSNTFIKLYVTSSSRPQEFSNIEYFHPTFLYESILNIIAFLILFTFFRNSKGTVIVSIYLILYSIIRIIIENIRIDSIYNIFNIPIAIIISMIMLTFGVCLLIYSLKKPS